MTRSAKHWCFTLNNYTNDECVGLEQRCRELVDSGKLVYAVYGYEVGDSGTPHLQGFFSCKDRVTMSFGKTLVSTRAHFEAARGTPAQAAAYCKEDGVYQEFGTLPAGRGQRSDLADLYDAIKSRAKPEEIADAFPSHFLRYRNNILATLREQCEQRTWMPENIIYWGQSGAGKTRKVFDDHSIADIYVHTGEQWFDGYVGQEVVLFDDFTGSEFKLNYLLKLLDRYPMRVPVKGGYVQWVPKTIYFTSNKDPATWYSNALEEHRTALFRRIEKIEHFMLAQDT